jgi:hypothetical protein
VDLPGSDREEGARAAERSFGECVPQGSDPAQFVGIGLSGERWNGGPRRLFWPRPVIFLFLL